MAKKQTFLDILGTRLAGLPDAARMVIALDPRRIMEIPNPLLDGRDELGRCLFMTKMTYL